ncbi:hypothetical protein C8J56DRAFT_560124 [Mycena floridula]|nr:hypothetical protein C8J56DRAFT_560124 [Mycena floridula]
MAKKKGKEKKAEEAEVASSLMGLDDNSTWANTGGNDPWGVAPVLENSYPQLGAQKHSSKSNAQAAWISWGNESAKAPSLAPAGGTWGSGMPQSNNTWGTGGGQWGHPGDDEEEEEEEEEEDNGWGQGPAGNWGSASTTWGNPAPPQPGWQGWKDEAKRNSKSTATVPDGSRNFISSHQHNQISETFKQYPNSYLSQLQQTGGSSQKIHQSQQQLSKKERKKLKQEQDVLKQAKYSHMNSDYDASAWGRVL